MKKLFFALLILSACSGEKKTEDFIKANGVSYSTVKVDSCEYLFAHSAYALSIVHKANCRNIQHLNRTVILGNYNTVK